MTDAWAGWLWVVGGYLVGTIPSTWLVSRARGGVEVLGRARRDAGETDAHMLMAAHLGNRWSAVAATADVVKAFGYVLLARFLGDLPAVWLAPTGVALLLGYCWPPYGRALAGRGLAVTAGVYLVLLPVPMAVMGGLILIGATRGDTGIWTISGLVLAPIIAAIRGQLAPYVAMAGVMLALIVLRRMEGIRTVVRRGVSPGRAVWYRLAYDSSGPRQARVVGEDAPPEADR